MSKKKRNIGILNKGIIQYIWHISIVLSFDINLNREHFKVIVEPRVCTNRYVLLVNHKTKSIALIILLAQTIEPSQRRNRTVRLTYNKKNVEKGDSEYYRNMLQFPYIVSTQNEHRTGADAYLQYYCA